MALIAGGDNGIGKHTLEVIAKRHSSSGNPKSFDNIVDNMVEGVRYTYVVFQPWCIQYLKLEKTKSYELKSGLIHLLPKFHGLASKDPHKHLKEFHVVCSTMRPHGIPKDYIKTKTFTFSLNGIIKDWLYL
ncbi:hypothetical protein CR513_54035, partial [Mucuna pruriens]